jgi:dimethylargininase
LIAITREISDDIAACELTHLERVPIDLARAREQHEVYERALEALGCRVERLPAGPGMPDSVFVEDIAVVLDETAIVTRPGALSRRVETPAVAEALKAYRPLAYIEEPGTLDGGDVIVAGRSVFVGQTTRTNREGFQSLTRALQPFGYTTTAVPVHGCLHLKSAVTALDAQTLLVNRAWVDTEDMRGFELIDVDRREPDAANILRVGDRLLYAAAFPRTLDRLLGRFSVALVDNSELAKAEGAVTCGSLLIPERPGA